METKNYYVRPNILVEEWQVYKETNSNTWGHRVYEVSNFGRVKLNGEFYEFNEKQRYYGVSGFYVHRAVAELFIPNPENKPCIDHIDANKHNNAYWNLRWVTHQENCNNPLTRQRKSELHKKVQKAAQNRIEVRQKKSESMKKYWVQKKSRKKSALK